MMNALNAVAVRLACALVVFLAIGTTVRAQEPESPPTPAAPESLATATDNKAHEAAVRLVAMAGVKEKLAANVDKMLDQGIAAMKTQSPEIPPQFIQEWRRRMKDRLNFEDFVAVVVKVYEKYFTADELDHLTAAAAESKQGKTPVLDDALKEKFQKNAIAMQSEIMGGSAQIGAKLGGEIGEEIGKEHPEWAPKPAPKSAPAAK
jgi:hypothetical protein